MNIFGAEITNSPKRVIPLAYTAYICYLVPRRHSLDEHVRAKEGGKEKMGFPPAVCTLPMVPCGGSSVVRLYLAKNEGPEEEADISVSV